MTVILSCTVLLLTGLLVGCTLDARRTRAQLARARAGGFAELVGKRVVATIVDGGSIRGVLTHAYDDALVLEHPEYVGGSSATAALGARVTIARTRVPLLQQFDEERPGPDRLTRVA